MRPIFKMMIFWQFMGSAKGMFFVLSSFHANFSCKGYWNVSHICWWLSSFRLCKRDFFLMLWNQIVFPSTASMWEALKNVTNCCNIMQFQRSKPNGGKKFFSITWVMCDKFNMLFFEKNPEFGRKRNSHKRYQEMLIHELVQPLLHKRNDDEPPTDMGCWSQPKKRSRINVQDDIRLRGRHYATKKHPRRKCTMCGYKKNKLMGERTNKCTLNYCEKCQKYICEDCFQVLHTQSWL